MINGEPKVGLLESLQELGAPKPLFMRMVPQALEPVRAGADTHAAQALWGQRLEDLRGERVHAVAGIGNPERFFRAVALARTGCDAARLCGPSRLHATRSGPAGKVADLDDGKDAVRCAAFATARHGFVPVTAQFSVEDAQTW